MAVAAKLLYEAGGLIIASDIPLPKLDRSAGVKVGGPDIEITLAPFLKNGADPASRALPGDVRSITLRIPDAGVFRMLKGTRIAVSPYAGADEELVENVVLGPCLDMLLFQRGAAKEAAVCGEAGM